MQYRQLEYVAATVQYKTMRKAAQNLYVSEAAMSQQIRALEAEFGFPLFERHGRLLQLSPEEKHYCLISTHFCKPSRNWNKV